MPTWLEEFSGSVRMETDALVTVTVGGVLHAKTTGQFRSLLDEALTSGATRVVVDMSGVSLLDAASLALLVSAARTLESTGARLEVRDVTARIYQFIRFAGLIQTLHVTRPTALDPDLLSDLTALVVVPSGREVLDAALQLVTTMAQAVVVGGDGASITLLRHGLLATVAASNDVVLQMDNDQYATGEGPCLDAARHGIRFHITALGEEKRWPAFVPRARARGINSVLSTPLLDADRPVGALNIYSRAEQAFAEHEMRWADQFAAEASGVLAVAEAEDQPTLRSHRLERALLSRDVIGLAQGRIMERHRLSPAASYTRIRRFSSTTGQPMRDLCEQIVNSDRDVPAAPDPRDGSPNARAST